MPFFEAFGILSYFSVDFSVKAVPSQEMTTEPFVIVFVPPEVSAEEGLYAMFMDATGSTEITVSIDINGVAVQPLDMKYMPTAVKEHLNLNIRNGASKGSLEMPYDHSIC